MFAYPTKASIIKRYLHYFVQHDDDIHRYNPSLGPSKSRCIDPWTRLFKKVGASIPPDDALANILVQIFALWKGGGQILDSLGQDGANGIDGQLHVDDIVMLLVFFRHKRIKSVLNIGCGGGHEARCWTRGNNIKTICLELNKKVSLSAMKVLYDDPICRRQCAVFPMDLLKLLYLREPLRGTHAPDIIYSHSKGMPAHLQASILLIALNSPSIRYVFISVAISKRSLYCVFRGLGLKPLVKGFLPMHLPSGDETNMRAYKVTKRGKVRVSPSQQKLLNQNFYHNCGLNLAVRRMDERDHVYLHPYDVMENNFSKLVGSSIAQKCHSDKNIAAVGSGSNSHIDDLDAGTGNVQHFLNLLDLPGTIGHAAVTAFNCKVQHDLEEELSRMQRTFVKRSHEGKIPDGISQSILHGDEYEKCFNYACGDASDEPESDGDDDSIYDDDEDDESTCCYCSSDDDRNSDCCNFGFE